ncbi:MAG: hypothetical protein M3N33_02485 [Actinomycetota bacterium]|nr:hypothetical protein [Actinomycetota bacterium]
MREGRGVILLFLVDVLESVSEEEPKDLAESYPDLLLNTVQDSYNPERHDGGLLLIKEGRVRVYLCKRTPRR